MLNGTAMGDEVFDAMNAIPIPSNEPITDEKRREIWRAICTAIVNHFKNNAVISTNVTVQYVSGVMSGTQMSGPGLGTGTGSIS